MSPRNLDHSSRLTRFSLDRRITVLVAFAAVLVMGGMATSKIPLELIPRGFQAPFLGVVAPWQDAPATEMVEKVTLPLEDELSTVPGIDRVFSFSTRGFSRVTLLFKQGTEMDLAYREVRDRIERARLRLPEDLEQVFIRKHDETGIPAYVLGLAIDPSVTDSYNLIQNEIVLRLSRIDGVASVETDGLEEKEILIEVDRERMAAAGLDIYSLARQLGGDNFSLSSGQVRAGGRKLLLRSVARYDDLEALESRPVSASARLRDIASVRYEVPEQNYRVRAMSKPAIALVVLKEGQANTLEVAARVADEVERMQRNPRLAGIEMVSLFNQREVILESLSTLLDSGRIGAGFAVLVLFFFLRRFRLTLIITLSIPLSILIGLTVMYFAGETLNIISLLGLMISVGLLVDNSVVVAENIFRLHRDGMPRRKACIEGASEIALAIVMATLTTIIVFLPASLVEGQAQFFLLRLSIPISVSLAASLLVALVLVPLAVYLTLPQNGSGSRTAVRQLHTRLNGVLRRAYDATFERLNDLYGRLLRRSLGRRADAVLLLTLVFAGTLALHQKFIDFVEQQQDEGRGFEIDVVLPTSTTLEEAEEYFLACEKVIEESREELGLDGWVIVIRPAYGELQGWYTNPRSTELSNREVTKLLLERLPEKPGARFFTGDDSETEDSEQAIWEIPLYGEDTEELEQVVEDLERLLSGVPGVLGPKRTADQVNEELGLVVDRERAQRQGVSPQVLAGVVGYALRGQALPRYSRDGREIPVRVRFEEEDRQSLDELATFSVPTESGGAVPLSSLTEVTFLPGTKRIFRQDKRTSRRITLELEEGKEKETKERLRALVERIDLPEAVSFGSDQGNQGMDEDLAGILFALALSVVFIYLLMAFLFESFVLPLSIVFTIPLAFLGVVWGHLLTGLDIDFLGAVGVVLLIGVVVNNGIVLIDYVNRLRQQGSERSEAILLAAHRRFRPILMTALTTICGMLPLLSGGSSSIGLSYRSFGITLIGGMLTSTALTLLVVPVLYTLFDDLREELGAVAGWALRRGRRVTGATSSAVAGDA